MVQRYMDGSRVIVVMPDDKLAMKKVFCVNMLNEDLIDFCLRTPV